VVVLSLDHSRLALVGLIQASAVVAISIATSMILLYATGCYRRDAILNRTPRSRAMPTALAISGAVLFWCFITDFRLFPSLRCSGASAAA